MVDPRSNTGGPSPVIANSEDDRRLFDAMPKRVRLALIEASYDYNSQMIWDAFRMVRAEYPFDSEAAAWDDVLLMLKFNERDARAKERQEYIALVEVFRREKEARLERVFQKAS